MAVRGEWTLANAAAIHREIAALPSAGHAAPVVVDAAALARLDTAGASLLFEAAGRLGGIGAEVRFDALRPTDRSLIELVRERSFAPQSTLATPHHPGLLWNLGRAAVQVGPLIEGQVRYFGYVAYLMLAVLREPRRLRWRELLTQCQRCGLDAIPVVILITFLIGVVMAYLLGVQAAQYGASVFVVDGVGLGMVREFAPLLVAIIVAGRSGAAFTAQLGTMRLTQETDAISMLGLDPGQVLVLPRVLALICTMPLLVFVGDLSGLVGAAAVCRWMLELPLTTFIDEIHRTLEARHAVIGILKAPLFALAIATLACRLGMTAGRDTRAIGEATTSTVVQAIVTVIVLDAICAVALQLADL